jgi:hypothetical protein
MAQSVQMLLLISYCLNTMVGKGALDIAYFSSGQ